MFNKIRNLFNKSKKNQQADEEFDPNFDQVSNQELNDEFANEFDDEQLPPLPANEEDQTREFEQDEIIDLKDGKLSFKDKINLSFEDIKNKVGRIKPTRPKKLSFPSSQEITGRIKIPKALEAANKLKIKSKISKVNWANIHNEFFSYSKRQNIHRFFQYSFIALITFTLAKSLGIMLSGNDDYKNLPRNARLGMTKENSLTSQHIRQIKNSKLFKTEAKKEENKEGKKPKPLATTICEKADGKSRLPIKLINTVVLQDSVKSIASVQVRSENLLQELRVGEKIDNMAKIGKIERSKLIVRNLKTGTCEAIESDEDQQDYSPIAVLSPKQSKNFKRKIKKIKGIDTDGKNFVIEKSFLKAKLANIGDIIKQARGIQINNPDGTISFKIVEVDPGGIFAYLGIENNDIITQINGQPINDLNAVMSLFSKLQSQSLSKLGLDIKRGGVNTPQQYKFK